MGKPNGFTVLQAGIHTTIQDFGRVGYNYYAIPTSGVMDRTAAHLALELLQVPMQQPLLECTALAPKLIFAEATQLVLTGADFDWRINGRQVARNSVLNVEAKAVLEGKFARNGWRGYLAINGDFDLPQVYGAYATYANARLGGYQGRLLRKGDCLVWHNRTDAVPRQVPEVVYTHSLTLPIYSGPEFDYLTVTARDVLQQTTYKIAAASNRMGIRLEGQPLESQVYQLTYSKPILPGFIQLPPSGLPVILMQDAQITGGYPRIAYVKPKDLGALSQLPLGGCLQFKLMK